MRIHNTLYTQLLYHAERLLIRILMLLTTTYTNIKATEDDTELSVYVIENTSRHDV